MLIGETVSHYKIDEDLGGGGMGVVYKATDTKLDRSVALKFLPPELTRDPDMKRRFVREAKAASALQHHNICTIHEIAETDDGRLFICMDYYRGKTLKQRIAEGPLPVEEAVRVALQTAEGLAKAHEAGIVHRDIKPANIVITNDGVVKIIDFGTAKLKGRSKLTQTGRTIGTIAYMSPEQATGRPVDHRSDIFSLGVVLYEMLTGRPPFESDHDAGVLYSIVNSDPAPLATGRRGAPSELHGIVKTMLAKECDDRYQSFGEVVSDLEALRDGLKSVKHGKRKKRPISIRLVAIVLASILAVIGGFFIYSYLSSSWTGQTVDSSIAVLPFVSLSDDPDDEFLSDGITEDLIYRLAKVGNLRVVSRTSVFQFKGQTADVRDIGKQLGVGVILEGTVRRSGDRLVLTAHLVDVADGVEIWSDRFEESLPDVFTIQDELSATIVDKLELQLTGESPRPTVASYTDNIEAYTLYLKGRYQWNIRSPEALEKAERFFEQATTIDSSYALAYAGLADVYLMKANYSHYGTNDLYVRAKAAARQATDIDPTLAEAHTSLALVSWIFDWDWRTADEEFARAVALRPAYATTHHWRAMFLAFMGRFDDAVTEIDLALAKDPVSLIINSAAGLLRYCARDFKGAIEHCLMALDMDPDFNPAITTLARIYLQMGDHDEATVWLEKSIEVAGRRPGTLAVLGYALATAGKREEAADILTELNEIERNDGSEVSDMVLIHVALGDVNGALDSLRKIGHSRGFGIFVLQADPLLADFRSTPAYAGTMKAIGFRLP